MSGGKEKGSVHLYLLVGVDQVHQKLRVGCKEVDTC